MIKEKTVPGACTIEFKKDINRFQYTIKPINFKTEQDAVDFNDKISDILFDLVYEGNLEYDKNN